jgi:hypothetical protein
VCVKVRVLCASDTFLPQLFCGWRQRQKKHQRQQQQKACRELSQQHQGQWLLDDGGDVAMTHLCAAKMNSRPDQSMTLLFVQHRCLCLELSFYWRFLFIGPLHPYQQPCQTRWVELFCVARTASGSAASVRFCAALPMSPTLFHGITLYCITIYENPSKKLNHFPTSLACQLAIAN